jgi:hypothetical protein
VTAKYILRHKPTGKVFNIKPYGLDLFNLGINPKIYDKLCFVEKDLEMFNLLQFRQLSVYSNAAIGLKIKGKPIWYNERHTKKLTKKQKEKLEWYENARRMNIMNTRFIRSLKHKDLVVEEYTV